MSLLRNHGLPDVDVVIIEGNIFNGKSSKPVLAE